MTLIRSFTFCGIFAALFLGSLGAQAGGFAAGNGGLGTACLEYRQDEMGFHELVVHNARLFDLVRWAQPYPAFKAREESIQFALDRIARHRPESIAAIRNEMAVIQKWVDYYRRKFEEGHSYSHIQSTDDYPDRGIPLYRCDNGEIAEVYQLARYETQERFYLAIEIYLALPPLDQGAFMIHEALYRFMTVKGREPVDASPLTRLVSSLYSRTTSDSELREIVSELFP